MRHAWNPGDLPIRKRGGHLRLVASEERADSLGAGRARSSGAAVPNPSPCHGAHLSVEDLADLEQLAILAARMESANAALVKAVRKRNIEKTQIAARSVMSIGLRAGDFSRQMEARGHAS